MLETLKIISDMIFPVNHLTETQTQSSQPTYPTTHLPDQLIGQEFHLHQGITTKVSKQN